MLAPALRRRFADAFQRRLRPRLCSAARLPQLLRFGSWIGGDRDGNPFVTPESTREALELARNTILSHYIADWTRYASRLAPLRGRWRFPGAPSKGPRTYAQRIANSSRAVGRISSSELYRRFLGSDHRRLRHSAKSREPDAYRSAARIREQISSSDPRKPCRESRSALAQLVSIRFAQIRTFGFHLCNARHSAACAQCMRKPRGNAKVRSSRRQRQSPRPSRLRRSIRRDRCSTRFRDIAELKQAYPSRRSAITSSAARESEDDVLAVTRLADINGYQLAASRG